jgi:hypothetical protein
VNLLAPRIIQAMFGSTYLRIPIGEDYIKKKFMTMVEKRCQKLIQPLQKKKTNMFFHEVKYGGQVNTPYQIPVLVLSWCNF